MANSIPSATLLVEILTEELPPKTLAKLGAALHQHLCCALVEYGFIAADAPAESRRWFATPRRLAVQITHCLAQQPDQIIEKKGPAVAAGLDAQGVPTKALQGFMRSTGLNFTDLQQQNDGKIDYFVAKIAKRGEALDVHLAALVEAALKKLPVAKIMRWGTGEAQFVRPVHGLVLMHGNRVVPGRVLGISSGNTSYGHRFLSSGKMVITEADHYAQILRDQGRVIADFNERRALIRQQLDTAASAAQLTWCGNDALIDEVTALVEWPHVYEAQFDANFLSVPAECLILTMQANQKYFPLMQHTTLSHRFLLVSNMDIPNPINIIQGNARVVRPRLADAQFFFNADRKTKLADRISKLDNIIYHNKLGSLGERVRRLQIIAAAIATKLGANVAHAERAALLAKADLTSNMVGEFPELQGIMGRYYALHDQEPDDVADAIAQHYQPRFNGDTLPQNKIACAVALADKLDALAGFFTIGEIPSGDKDPYGLRRAAIGCLRIILEHKLPLDLHELLHQAIAVQPHGTSVDVLTQIYDFMLERLRRWLPEQGYAANIVSATLAIQPLRLEDLSERLAAVLTFIATPEATALAAANKRIVNILKKNPATNTTVDVALLNESAEKTLYQRLQELAPSISAYSQNRDYRSALQQLSLLRAEVDSFFDTVMVMCEDLPVRANRLALLALLAAQMNQVADISKL